MYSKEELLSKEMSELEDIAKTLGADYNGNNKEELVYSILDKQAIDEGTKNPLGQKKKRTRIVKKDTDRVYSVKGKEGENFDVKNNKMSPCEQPSLFKEIDAVKAKLKEAKDALNGTETKSEELKKLVDESWKTYSSSRSYNAAEEKQEAHYNAVEKARELLLKENVTQAEVDA